MKRILLLVVLMCPLIRGQGIAPVASFTKDANGITLNCEDGSQVRITILAPDLVRVRAAFTKPLPLRDHSWAIAKAAWDTPRWSVTETPRSITASTDELEIVAHRSPLLIEFRNAATHRPILADQRPMMFDAKTGAVAAAKKLGFDEHFYGLGEKAARLDKRRGQFTMWNSDTPAYKEGTDPIYQDIPFYIGLQNGAAYGVFFDNSYRTHFDFGGSSQEYATFSAEGGEMNYYFFGGPGIPKILARYADLTGHMPMPPKWALGNQQSRWSYYPDTLAEEVVWRYRNDDLPLDVLHLDIDYMDGYRVFTWDPQRFADPKDFVDKLKEQGVKVVTIVDPGVKYQPDGDKRYAVFDEGAQRNYFLKRKDGQLYIGRVWPGESVFVDYTLPDASRWWGGLFRSYTDPGVAGIWLDMNEPADFIDQTGKSQMDVISYDEGENSTHAKNRNVFALGMARATREGLLRMRPNERPYIITRAAYAGIQRYSTMWTGDNTSTWDALGLTIPMFATLGLSGEPFVGGDIGGFIGRSDGELLTRWYEAGFLTPFCRNHKDRSGYDHEPWRFGTYYEDIIRRYLKLRYRFLPFLYTVLEEAHRTGMPVFRALLLNYQEDANTLTIDDEFMIGRDLLVAPVLHQGQTSRLVYLPEGAWFDYWTGKTQKGGTMIRVEAPLETVPLFVRAGAVIPMQPEMNYVGEKPASPLTFQIYGDSASGTLYEDDGLSPAYEQGAFHRTEISISGGQINVQASGPYDPGKRKFVFNVHTGDRTRTVQMDDDSKPHRVGVK